MSQDVLDFGVSNKHSQGQARRRRRQLQKRSLQQLQHLHLQEELRQRISANKSQYVCSID